MDRIPLHVLTGFLGSGKTTLLNRLVRDPAVADSAVLINEIGTVAIDHHLVERMDGSDGLDVMVLAGGCTCCAVRGDLVAALRDLHRRRADGSVPPFRRVVIETTGLADPAPLLFTLVGDPVLRHRFAAGAVIATVDALHVPGQIARHPECRKQVAVADRLILTKTDLADARTRTTAGDLVRKINPAAQILDAGALGSLAAVLDGPAASLAAAFADRKLRRNDAAAGDHAPHAEHTTGIQTAAVVLDAPIDWSAFAVWLSLFLHAHGADVLRFKAILDVRGWPAPVALNGIHHLIHPPAHLPGWAAGGRASRLIFITQGIDADAIDRSLRTFLAAAEADASTRPFDSALAAIEGPSAATRYNSSAQPPTAGARTRP